MPSHCSMMPPPPPPHDWGFNNRPGAVHHYTRWSRSSRAPLQANPPSGQISEPHHSSLRSHRAMSISRKRVGSVSQRNDSPLPPLDIQSIHMPNNPQNALALKTAALSSTKSLFQMASSLRKRLRLVEGFAPFLEQPPSAPHLDVVAHMCHVLRLGSSLCHLYNALIPSFTTPGSALYADLPAPAPLKYDFPNFADPNDPDWSDGVRNWAKRSKYSKACQKYIYTFCTAMKQRREEGRWPIESWAIHELWGKSKGDDSECESYDSSSLMKVFQTVEAMLDNLPASAILDGGADSLMSPVASSPATRFGSGSSLSLAGAVGPMTSINGNSRKSYPEGGYSVNSSTTLVNSMNGGNGHDDMSKAGPGPSTMEYSNSPATECSDNAFKTIEELVNSERSYVQELEILERCSVEILNAELISPETVYSIFSNLRQILDFQRKFLIKLESEYESIEEFGQNEWTKGRWGRPFVDMEKEFEVYGPYCANYLDAMKVVSDYNVNLMLGQDLPEGQRPCLHPERELQAFMIKPVQRITKYGLLLEAILRATAKHEYPHRHELEEGIAAVRRIANDINEMTDYKSKQATVRDLVDRVDDWKGHDYEKFGDLHLDDQFTVSKADSPRDYHVFLFEKMMLCCKEVQPDKKSKGGKNGNMLRKDKTASKGQPPPKARLALKGRIFVSNITAAHLIPAPQSDQYAPPRVQIIWSVPSKSGDAEQDIEDSFVMTGRSEEQMRKWADKVMELANKARKENAANEYSHHRRNSSYNRQSDGSRTPYWATSTFAPPTPGADQQFFGPGTPGGPPGYHGQDEAEDDQSSGAGLNGLAIYGVPGVPFPSANRRAQSQQSLPPAVQAELRTRAMTEDQNGPSMTQWRQQAPPLPHLPRITSGTSAAASEASWGNAPTGNGHHTRRQPSQSNGDDMHAPPGAFARYDQLSQRGMPRQPSGSNGPPPPNLPTRARTASSPNVFGQHQAPLPPLPVGAAPSAQWSGANGASGPYPSGSAPSSSPGLGSTPGGTTYFNRRMSAGKRSSQESETTETSETSSGSPRTPYTNATAGDLRGATPVSRQNSQDAAQPSKGVVYIKVRSGDANFVIGMPSDVTYRTLYEKVVKKLRLCSARHATAGLDLVVRIKWLDSDGDEIAIKTDSDVQVMLIESTSGQIQLIAV